MADEAVEGAGLALNVCNFPQCPKTLIHSQYTLPVYLEFAEALQARAKELGGGWTAEDIGRALWARAHQHVVKQICLGSHSYIFLVWARGWGCARRSDSY